MLNLWNTFLGYIRISYSRIPWILLFACLFCALFGVLSQKMHMEFKQNRKNTICLLVILSLNCAFIFVMTLFNRLQDNYGFSLIPFESYRAALSENNVEILLQNIINIAMYIPIGFLLPCCFRYFEKARRVLAATIICSVGIELIQWGAKIGYLEVDDVLNNIFGAVLGVLVYKLLVQFIKPFKVSIN